MKKLIFLLLLALPFFGFSQAAYLMEFTNPNGSKVVFNLNDVRSCVAEGTGSYLFTRTGSGKTQVQESPATIALNSCGNIVLFTVYSPLNQYNTTKQMGVNPNYVVGVVSNTSGNGVLKMVTPTENFTTTGDYDAAVAALSNCVSGGGGGGSLTNTYVGFGDGLNQLDGEAGFTYDAEANRLAVDTVKTKRITAKAGSLELDSDVKANKYPNTRNDTGLPVNVLTTGTTGGVESHPVSEFINTGNGIYLNSNQIQLGNSFSGEGLPGSFTTNRYLNMNNFRLHLTNGGDDANSVAVFSPYGDVIFGGNTFTNAGRNVFVFGKSGGTLSVGLNANCSGSYSINLGNNISQTSGSGMFLGGLNVTYNNGVGKGFLHGESIIDFGGERNFCFGGMDTIGRYTKQCALFGNYLKVVGASSSDVDFNQILFGRNSTIDFLAGTAGENGYNFFNVYNSLVKGNYSFGSGQSINSDERYTFTGGSYLNNHTRSGVVLGHRNVSFTTSQNNTDWSQTNGNNTLLFALGNGDQTASISSNAFTVTRSGNMQVNNVTGTKSQNDVTPMSALEVVSTSKGLTIPRLTSGQVTTWQASFNGTTDVTGPSGAGDEKHSRQGESVFNLTTGTYLQATWTGSAWRFDPLISKIGAVGSTPNANGATISGSTLNLEPANATNPGVVSTVAQTFTGQKTINMASSGAVTQNLILDNTATAAVNSATSMAQSVAGVQRGEVRTTLTEIVGGGADFAKVELKSQDGGALKTGVLVDMKNAGVDNVSILPGNDGALTTARRIVQPYGTISLTGSQTLTAGYNIVYLTNGGLGTATYDLTLPPTADMIDGEIYRVVCSFAPAAGTNLQFILNSGQTYNGASPGSIGFVTGGGGQVNKNYLLQFVAGDWRLLNSN